MNLEKDISSAGFKHCLVYLLLLGLIVRAGFMVEHAASPSFGVLTLDQKYYDTAARMILAGEDLHPLHGLRPLLYPFFLAACYKTGGAHGIDLAVAAQHLFGVLTGLIVALLGARLFRHRLCGIAGGLLYMLAPVPLYFEGELLIESSYVFLLVAALWLTFRAADSGGARAALFWLLSGGLLVLTSQARPNILVFLAVYPLFAVRRWWQYQRGAALLPLLGLMGAGLMAAPWGFINKIQSSRFQVIPSEGGVNLYFGNKRGADGMEPEQGRRVTYGERYEDSSEIWAREDYESAMRAQHREPEKSQAAVSKYWTQRAIEEIKADPAAWLKLMAKKSWLMLWNAEVPNNKAFAFLQNEFLWLRLLPVRWVVLLMLAPAGIWAAAKWGGRDALFILLLYTLLYSAANVVFFICDRFRYPVWPAMAAIAGGGLVAFIESIRRREWRAAMGMAAGMALMAAVSLPNWFDAKLPTFARDYVFHAVAWYEKGHFPEALNDIDRSLALDPSDVTALHQRGNVLLALDRFADAARDYAGAIKLSPGDAGIWNNYALALDGVGRTNDALDAFRNAMRCQPPSQSAFLGMAFEQIKLGHLDDAISALDQLEKKKPGPDAIALALRAVVARQHGDAARADALEKQARALDPNATTWALDRAAKFAHP